MGTVWTGDDMSRHETTEVDTGRPPPKRKRLTFEGTPEWLRPRIAARLASVSRRTIDRWIRRGDIKSRRPSPAIVLVSRDSLRAFIEASDNNEEGAA